MTALVFYVHPESSAMLAVFLLAAFALLGIGLLVVACVQSRRVGRATVAALVMAVLFDIIILNPCRDLTPSDPMYWILGCFGLPGA